MQRTNRLSSVCRWLGVWFKVLPHIGPVITQSLGVMLRLVFKSPPSRATHFTHCRPSPHPTVNIYTEAAFKNQTNAWSIPLVATLQMGGRPATQRTTAKGTKATWHRMAEVVFRKKVQGVRSKNCRRAVPPCRIGVSIRRFALAVCGT